MIQTLALLVALTSLSASATPLSNINGMQGRLETISCRGGNVASKAKAETVYQMADKQCKGLSGTAMDSCFKKVIKANTTSAAVMFRGQAIPEQKQIEMTIKTISGNQLLFKSLREGYHADGNEGQISLVFHRVGISNDDYIIETGRLLADGNLTPQIIVPVKRRALEDQIYFFFDCRLSWIY